MSSYLFVYHSYDDVLEIRLTNLPNHEWVPVGELVKGDITYPIMSCIISSEDEGEAAFIAKQALEF